MSDTLEFLVSKDGDAWAMVPCALYLTPETQVGLPLYALIRGIAAGRSTFRKKEDVARALGWSPSKLYRVANLLEEAGWLTRVSRMKRGGGRIATWTVHNTQQFSKSEKPELSLVRVSNSQICERNTPPLPPRLQTPTESGSDSQVNLADVSSSLFNEEDSPGEDPDAFDVRCPQCASPSGMACTTPSGKRSSRPHAARLKLKALPKAPKPANGCNDETYLQLYASYPGPKTREARGRYFQLAQSMGWGPVGIQERLDGLVAFYARIGNPLPTLAMALASRLEDGNLDGLEHNAKVAAKRWRR